MANRDIRRIINTKQDSLESDGNLSINSMSDGQVSIGKSTNELLSIRKKKYGRIYKSYMSSNGNQIVDKNLAVKGNLNVKGHILGIQYYFFIHNFADNMDTSKIYLPWTTTSEGGDMNASQRSLLTPFKMTLNKLYFRPETLSDGTANFTFGLDKQDDGDTTVDSIATFTYEPTLSSNTMITVSKSDFNNTPTIEAGKKAGLFVQANPDPSDSIDWYVTSVWEVEIVL